MIGILENALAKSPALSGPAVRVRGATYLFVIPDCDDSVLNQDAVDAVDRMLPVPVPRFSKSPVLFCFLILSPCTRN